MMPPMAPTISEPQVLNQVSITLADLVEDALLSDMLTMNRSSSPPLIPTTLTS